MKFNDYKYERPDLEALKNECDKIIKGIAAGSDNLNGTIKSIDKYLNIMDDIDTMVTLVSIRNSINTVDEFYETEKEYWDENMPIIQGVSNDFAIALLGSPHRTSLESKYGKLLFDMLSLQQKTFNEAIIPLLQKENKLSTEYSKLIASAKIEYEGEIYNLNQIAPFVLNKNRDVRRKADTARLKFFEEHESDFDRIYDELVKLRHEMALALGYENYVQLGYDKLGRLDYNSKDVASYRAQVYETVVPVVSNLELRKSKRLGIANPQHYDIVLAFLSGNPTPKGDREWMVNNAKTMYHEMSKETDEFFSFMVNHDLFDLDSKTGKASGGYCTYIPKYRSPFIFANFNGTSHDADVLTHEAGHAFQVYQSRDLFSYYRWPTMEAAEIHSMSMEFFAWPWIHLFFESDTEKYKFDHLAGSISFLPYGVTVDEFQHYVYENPHATPAMRKSVWRSIEKKYMPYKKYDETPFLDKGTWWYRQGHIFDVPFYYIDYTLAQVCAFQYWIKDHENHHDAWNNYLSLCKLGGSKSFVELLETVKLQNPFKKGTIRKIIDPLNAYLDSIDDTKL